MPHIVNECPDFSAVCQPYIWLMGGYCLAQHAEHTLRRKLLTEIRGNFVMLIALMIEPEIHTVFMLMCAACFHTVFGKKHTLTFSFFISVKNV